MEFLVSEKKDGKWELPMKMTAFASLEEWRAMWKSTWNLILTPEPSQDEVATGITAFRLHICGEKDRIFGVVSKVPETVVQPT